MELNIEYLILFLTAIFAGALNSVAGGGSFFTFPMLLFTGINPLVANATNTVAVWPGMVASIAAYRKEIAANRRYLPLLMTTSFIGSVIGSLTLINTSSATFEKLIPYLLLFATMLFAFGGKIAHRLRQWKSFDPSHPGGIVVQLVIAIYGGYFGGGMGIMMLALLAMMGFERIHEMNGLKTVLTSTINGVSVAIFIYAGLIAWPQALSMIVGTMLGGYAGAYYAQKIKPEYVRWFVIITGCAMTLYFFLKR